MSVSNKKQEFEQRKRIKRFDDFWVRAYRFDFAPKRRCSNNMLTEVKIINDREECEIYEECELFRRVQRLS